MGPIAVVTADCNGTLGVSSSSGLSNLASFSDVQANSAGISNNAMLIAGNSMAITDLQDRQTMLFDLANQNSEQIRRANEGVALALSMKSPIVMPGQRVGVSGGLGYFKNRRFDVRRVSCERQNRSHQRCRRWFQLRRSGCTRRLPSLLVRSVLFW